MPAPRPRVLLVSFASGQKFEEAQQRLDESLHRAEIDAHWRWNASSFQSGSHGAWYTRHESVNFRRGGAWKPYIILQALLRVRRGDWLIYHDASQYFPEGFSSSVRPMLDWLETQRSNNPCECLAAVRLRQTVQHEWEQRCAPPYGKPLGPTPPFEVLCGVLQRIGTCPGSQPEDCCRSVWHGPMTQHAWSVWRKNPASLKFLQEWVAHSENPEVLPVLPFVDQSLNGLLLYKLQRPLGIRALWVPSLYESSWTEAHDLAHHGHMAFGRNDGTPFKHMNHFLDVLYNERVLGKKLLWLVDLGSKGAEALGSIARLAWEEAAVPPRHWQRSLCFPIKHRPGVAASVTHAQLYLSRTAGLSEGHLWGPSYRAPVAWHGPVRELGAGGRAPGSPGRLTRDDTDTFGETRLYEMGWSEALFLGAWRVDALPRWAAQVSVSVGVFHDGSSPWPQDAVLCHAGGGNITFPHFHRSCFDGDRQDGWACRSTRPNQRASLLFAVPLPAAKPGAAPGWREARWGLCDPGGGRPFGVLLRALILPGNAPGATASWGDG